jgi:3-hydroxyisobutyrate dehydrogenase-like beta-hydroxyacid dehydrogenase
MNLNLANMAQAICESISLCRAAGISDDTYFEALSRNVGRSGLSDLKEPKLRAADYSPQFSLKHMGKDLRLALETAAALGLDCTQTKVLKQSYDQAIAAGWQEDDFIGLIRALGDSQPD